MKKVPFIFLFLLLIAAIVSCEKVTLEQPEFNETVSFQEDIIPIFESKCVTCHDGTTDPDLRSENAYQELTSDGFVNIQNPEESELYTTLRGSHDARATELEKQKILAWIKQGAEND